MQFMLKIVVCDDDALCCKEIVKGIRDTLGSTPADISDFRDPTLLLEHLRKTDCQPPSASKRRNGTSAWKSCKAAEPSSRFRSRPPPEKPLEPFLHDTLTQDKRRFEPLDPARVFVFN